MLEADMTVTVVLVSLIMVGAVGVLLATRLMKDDSGPRTQARRSRGLGVAAICLIVGVVLAEVADGLALSLSGRDEACERPETGRGGPFMAYVPKGQ